MRPSAARRTPVRLAALVAAGVVGAATLGGCGISTQSISPGVAAKVGSSEITVDQVDSLATPTCEVLDASPNGLGVGLSGETLRNGILIQLVLKQVMDQIAAENGIDAQTEYNKALAQQKAALGSLDPALVEKALPVLAVSPYAQNVRDAVLEKTDPNADPSTSQDATRKLLTQWQSDHTLEVNPMFTQIDFADQTAAKVREEFSVAVSDEAKAGTSNAPDTEESLSKLPPSQRCTGTR